MQVRGDFSISDTLHGDIRFAFAFGLRRDRITALRLIAIFSRQADVIMLASAVAHPGREFERERFYVGRLRLDVRNGRDLPVESWFHRFSTVIARRSTSTGSV